MEGHRIGETNFSQSGPSNHHLTYAFQHGLITNSPTATNFIQQGSAFDFGELEEAIVLQGVNFRNDEAKKSFFTTRPAATLEMFPAWPMRIQPTLTGSSKSVGGGGPGVEESTTGSGSVVVAAQMNNTTTTVTCKPDFIWEPDSPISKKSLNQVFDQKQQQHNQEQQQKQLQIEMANETTKATGATLLHIQQQAPKTLEKRKGAGSTSNKPLDPKTLRRLAQNREAAKKSRLRKKAYVQQLESSRIKLAQLEQDLHRARSQGLFLAAAGGAGGNLSSEATLFDMEYARWIEEEHGHISELRTGLQAHLSDGELRVILDRYLSHYDDIFRLKGMATKSDVFHLITGMWITPAERCFLWMGGFRPSELLKVLMPQLDSLTEQQFMGICSLQQCSQQAEEALSQGLDQLYHSLTDTISSNGGGTGSLSCINSDGSSSTTNVGDFMGQMALALGKLSNLQGFLSQADNLRQQTLHQLRRILTVRQAARCFLAIGEYYNRLRSLSSLWATRPRENFMSDDNSCQTTTDLHMVQQAHNQFSSF